MSVLFGGLGEMTPRSVWGVNAKGGKPGMELLAGVVAGLFVVRSVLWTQVASASRSPKAASRRVHGSFESANAAADDSTATQHATWMRIGGSSSREVGGTAPLCPASEAVAKPGARSPC